MPKPEPYEIPAQDSDLLDCGAIITRSRLAEAGFRPCPQCREMVPPRWFDGSGFCSRLCRISHERESLAVSIRQAERRSEALHWLEVGMVEIALTNRLVQLGIVEPSPYRWAVEVDPRSGFTVTLDGARYVGARVARWSYHHTFKESYRDVLNQILLDTAVPTTGVPSSIRPVPRRYPVDSTSEERMHWVWRLHVLQSQNFAQVGRSIGRSGGRVQDIYQETLGKGRKEAAQFIEPLRETAPHRHRAVRPPQSRPTTAWGQLDNIPEEDEFWEPVERPWVMRRLTRPEARNLSEGYATMLRRELNRRSIKVQVSLADGKERDGQVSVSKARIMTPDGLSKAENAVASDILKTLTTYPQGSSCDGPETITTTAREEEFRPECDPPELS